jgi:hypothetical protein
VIKNWSAILVITRLGHRENAALGAASRHQAKGVDVIVAAIAPIIVLKGRQISLCITVIGRGRRRLIMIVGPRAYEPGDFGLNLATSLVGIPDVGRHDPIVVGGIVVQVLPEDQVVVVTPSPGDVGVVFLGREGAYTEAFSLCTIARAPHVYPLAVDVVAAGVAVLKGNQAGVVVAVAGDGWVSFVLRLVL